MATGAGTAGERGFSLLELVLVLVILAILASVFLPIGIHPIREADLARANADVEDLAMGLTRFFVDLSRLPACDGDDCHRVVVAGMDQNNGLRFLAVGPGRGSLADYYPDEQGGAATRWNLAAQGHRIRPAANNAANHLLINDPNGDGRADELDYPSSGRSRWRGPYLARGSLDPWGHAYIISVGAMESGGSPIAPNARGWIVSAGPNGILETAPDTLVLGGDDIGMILREVPVVP